MDGNLMQKISGPDAYPCASYYFLVHLPVKAVRLLKDQQ